MSKTNAQVRRHWVPALQTRTRLLAAARQRHEWQHNAQSLAILNLRKVQVAKAKRVLAHHPVAVPAHGISDHGVAFIAAYEGFVGHAYKPVAAEPYWTIGYGHYGPDVRPGHTLSRPQGAVLLHHDIDTRYAPPVLALHLPRQCMTDALISLVYNCGPGILGRGHTLGDALATRNWARVADAILVYDKDATGRRNPGLTARRRAERAMFLGR